MGIGIPQLLVPSIGSIGRAALTLAQGALFDFLTVDTKWGIYYQGSTQEIILGKVKPSSISGIAGQATSLAGVKSLLSGELLANNVFIDSVVSISQKKGSELSNYRLETGSFTTYNKVEAPRQVNIRITKGGTEEERGLLLVWLDMVSKGYTKKRTKIKTGGSFHNNYFDIYVPEVHYPNMTLVDYSITRDSSSGVSLLIADCIFQEIMQVSMQYSSSKTSNSTQAQDIGAEDNSVQANKPSLSILDKIKGVADSFSSVADGLGGIGL